MNELLTPDTNIATLNSISGVDMVVVEYRLRFKPQRRYSWEEVSRRRVTLFEFEGQLFKQVVDYC